MFEVVENSSAHYGVVPIDNSTIGPVLETMAALRSTKLSVRGMTALKIGHALLARGDVNLATVERVYSHEQVSCADGRANLIFRTDPRGPFATQGIGQCVGYLAKEYPKVKVVEVNSTAKAAQEAAKDQQGLAICSPKCAQVYGLSVVQTDIQDGGSGEFDVREPVYRGADAAHGAANTTRFVVLSKHDAPLAEGFPVARPASTHV